MAILDAIGTEKAYLAGQQSITQTIINHTLTTNSRAICDIKGSLFTDRQQKVKNTNMNTTMQNR